MTSASTISILTSKLIILLSDSWNINCRWWEKCQNTYNLYLELLKTIENKSIIIVRCIDCNIEFPINSKAKKNKCRCFFGCRQLNKKRRDREAQKRYRQKNRHKANYKTDTNSPKPNENNPDFIESIKSIKFTPLAQGAELITVKWHII